jgi:hypothetical protein
MGNVQSAIDNSALGRRGSVYIANAWSELLDRAPGELRRTRDQWKKAPTGTRQDTCPLVMDYLGAPTRSAVSTRVAIRPNLEEVKANKAQYVAWGAAVFTYNKKFFGVCNDFAAAVAGALCVSRPVLLPKGTPVEVYGILSRDISDLHMFTVVGRSADSDPAQPDTWGAGCFAVDQWYGLQTATNAVKSVAPGPFHDTVFLDWLRTSRIVPQVEFLAGYYPPAVKQQ